MNLIQATVQNLLPPKRKSTPSGWISFNASCCHHNGNSPDKRQRGGMLFNNDGFQYHCFNCNFKAGWTPGKLLSKNTKNLLSWMGLPEVEIQKLGLEALKNKEDMPKVEKPLNFDLKEVPLPEDTESIISWARDLSRLNSELRDKFYSIVQYIDNRGFDPYDQRFYWSPAPGYSDRVIIAFYQDGKIVGYTGRKITDGKPKYLTDAQPGYVFNIDEQTADRKYVIVVEGQFDALAVEGCAIMHNEPNDTQVTRLNMLQREVIVVPDRDKPGAKMIKAALAHGWSVSMPPWEDDIKDVADAMKRYGRLYTLTTILYYRERNEIKIQLLKKKLEGLNG
jgi:5S rRNA maturation endonuclease (ribonuclease M5)